MFGENQPIILHLLDIPPMMGVLEGVVMEIHDCALPLVLGRFTVWHYVVVGLSYRELRV